MRTYAAGRLAPVLGTDTEPFDFHFHGTRRQLTDGFGNPKPVPPTHPPIHIGGRVSSTPRMAAEHADPARDTIGRGTDAGFRHTILGPAPPYPDHVARWLTEELITTSTGNSTRHEHGRTRSRSGYHAGIE
ncbi:hypothetical protein ACWDBD_16150 [Streptomyces sp. NPDC001118]